MREAGRSRAATPPAGYEVSSDVSVALDAQLDARILSNVRMRNQDEASQLW